MFDGYCLTMMLSGFALRDLGLISGVVLRLIALVSILMGCVF